MISKVHNFVVVFDMQVTLKERGRVREASHSTNEHEKLLFFSDELKLNLKLCWVSSKAEIETLMKYSILHYDTIDFFFLFGE